MLWNQPMGFFADMKYFTDVFFSPLGSLALVSGLFC